MKKTKCICFDLDGTLCELKPKSEANNHTGDEKPTRLFYDFMTWTSFDPRESAIIILTGRKEKYRAITEKWLERAYIVHDRLIMQEKSMADKNHIFKEEKLKKLMQEYEIIAMYDDNPLVADVCVKLWIKHIYP